METGEIMDNETIKLFEKLVYKIAKKYSYNNEEFDRKLDDRADKNNYRTM